MGKEAQIPTRPWELSHLDDPVQTDAVSVFQKFGCFWLVLSSIGKPLWFLGPRISSPPPLPQPYSLHLNPHGLLSRDALAALLRASCLTCRLEIPTAVMTPNITRNMPPITGVGMVAKAAPIFPNRPIRSSKQPAATITILLPTCRARGVEG